MTQLQKTVFHPRHVSLGAQMVDFGGWEMPIQYPGGIVAEHLATRKQVGIFDVSHMGRFRIGGASALAFVQHVLTNNAAALEVDQSQYTLIPNEAGGAIDDAYLYRFEPDAFLLVVNAANREKDWNHLNEVAKKFSDLTLEDISQTMAMISLQGPTSKTMLSDLITSGALPEPMRNALSTVTIKGEPVFLARTGYTGEPLCFELFLSSDAAVGLWDRLTQAGAVPVGLGARDTLRLEAGLPLYGHELGMDPDGLEIPIFASSLSRFAVSFSALKGDFIGRRALSAQFEALKSILNRDDSHIDALPRIIQPLIIEGKGIARAGSRVFCRDRCVGVVTSGTMVPFWKTQGEGLFSRLTNEKGMRAIALALVEATLCEGDAVSVDIRGKQVAGRIVSYHLRSEAPPYARAITCLEPPAAKMAGSADHLSAAPVRHLIQAALDNTRWRQQDCINLIPSEQSPSALVRRLSVLDPAGRYAEHKAVKAFCDAEVFYYQGTAFIARVEDLLAERFRAFLGCRQVETRMISGQMANTAFYSALVDYRNRADRKQEQRRLQMVMNHHIIRGGHLSAQPMGALRDFVARDPSSERPAVINFPVLAENPYQIDVAACKPLLQQYRPELIILGKSMTLHREPVAEMRALIDELGLDCVLMYDMAHVLGLLGPHFQEPFREGADVVTGSTHKTYFGSQRGIVATDVEEHSLRWPLWEAIQRRTFPGSVSNHHLGTLVGLLAAAYEMEAFKDAYQASVVANAKAFARALADTGLAVAGDPAISFTETHQVILEVGYARGADAARVLEDSNIIVNYQATPREEGFTASGALRMGVAEMTRFGMEPADFQQLAQLIADVLKGGKPLRETVTGFRRRFLEMRYCFGTEQIGDLMEQLAALV
jgi:aminomethyltransferase